MCGISPQKAWSNNFSYKKMGWVYFGTTKFENDANRPFCSQKNTYIVSFLCSKCKHDVSKKFYE